MSSRTLLLLTLLAAVLCCTVVSVEASIGCRDEQGNPVDWWIMIKLPQLHDSSFQPVHDGYGYVYMDKNNPAFTMGSEGLNTNLDGALGGTLAQIYQSSADQAFIMYNDETPGSGSTHDSYGHTKGDVAFDDKSGFWLVHSVPRFPFAHNEKYSYPENESRYGQSFLCMTYDTNTFNDVGAAFLLNKPAVYDSQLPEALANRVPNMKKVLEKKFNTNPSNAVYHLTTIGQKNFFDFAKNSQWDKELYEDFVAPVLQSNLAVETWMNGSGKMNTSCRADGFKWNVQEIHNITIQGNFIKETKDHSKWGITTSPNKMWTCIGDINRMFHQEQRGGGTVCTDDSTIWQQFRNIITGIDLCNMF